MFKFISVCTSLLLLLLLQASNIEANSEVPPSYQMGKVIYLFAHEGDVAMVHIDSEFVNKASCNTVNEWAFSLSTEAGKAMYAALLSAASQNLDVLIVGYSHDCSVWGDREKPAYVRVSY